ncbi:MAG: alanine racemase [Longimicrobiales bacterium]
MWGAFPDAWNWTRDREERQWPHSTPGAAALLPGRTLRAAAAPSPIRFDPWVEVDPTALRHNVEVVARLTGGRPILAVIRNNAYGLGLREVAGVLEPLAAVAGFAVVKAEAALALRTAGVRKPVVLMALFDDDAGRSWWPGAWSWRSPPTTAWRGPAGRRRVAAGLPGSTSTWTPA